MRKGGEKMKKLATTASLLGAGLYALALPVMAAETVDLCTKGTILEKMCNLKLAAVISAGIQFILIVALILAFVFLVIGGIRWILSGGDKAGTETARGTLTAALIGLVIVFLAWMMLNIAGTFFGFGTSSFTLPIVGEKAVIK